MDIRSRPRRGLKFPCLCLLLSNIAFPTCLCTVPIYQDPNQSCGVFAIPFTFVISSLSAGNPAPQAEGGSPYIALTCIIPHLNIVLTIKFGSFLFVGSFLLTGLPPKTEKRSQFLSKSSLSSCLVIPRRGRYYGHLVMCQPTTSGAYLRRCTLRVGMALERVSGSLELERRGQTTVDLLNPLLSFHLPHLA